MKHVLTILLIGLGLQGLAQSQTPIPPGVVQTLNRNLREASKADIPGGLGFSQVNLTKADSVRFSNNSGGSGGGGFSGSYLDLTNRPTIPVVPAWIPTSDPGYRTEAQVLALTGPISASLTTLNAAYAAFVSATNTALAGKQATLVSGSTIKTINGITLLGSGDIVITAGGGSGDVTTTGTQTLTNKTLTAPVITSPSGLAKTDVGLGNVDNTSDVNKPVSTAQSNAISLKADQSALNTTNTAVATKITQAQASAIVRDSLNANVSQFSSTYFSRLPNGTYSLNLNSVALRPYVDSVAALPRFVTLTGTQALTNKTLTSPIITAPTGLVKADVGLGSVDNTSDANKPVSTAQQTALNLKQNTLTLTTTGTSGAATLNVSTGVLNIPQYTGGGGSATTDASQLTSGTLPDARLSTNVVQLAGVQTLTDKTLTAPTIAGGTVTGTLVVPTQGNTTNNTTVANTATVQNMIGRTTLVHTTGTTVATSNTTQKFYDLVINPASTLSTLTIPLPTAPIADQIVRIIPGGTITTGPVVSTVTVTSTQGIIQTNPLAALTAGGEQADYQYKTAYNKWVRIGAPGMLGILANDITTVGNGVTTQFGPNMNYVAARTYVDSSAALRAPAVNASFEAVTYAASLTIAHSAARPNKQIGTLTTNNTAITITGAVNGSSGMILFIQDATGGRYVTINGTAQNISVVGNAITAIIWTYNGSTFQYFTNAAGVSAAYVQNTGSDLYLNSASGKVQINSQGNIHVEVAGNTSYWKQRMLLQGANIEFESSANGPLLRTPDGTKKYKIGVDNAGLLTTTLIP